MTTFPDHPGFRRRYRQSQTNRAIAQRYEFLDRQQYRQALEAAGFQVQGIGKTRTGNMVIVAAAVEIPFTTTRD
jgi:hypothetical protein